jgi:hypothetical protein
MLFLFHFCKVYQCFFNANIKYMIKIGIHLKPYIEKIVFYIQFRLLYCIKDSQESMNTILHNIEGGQFFYKDLILKKKY